VCCSWATCCWCAFSSTARHLLINQYAVGKQDDGLGCGLTHLTGGVLAINVKVTVMMLVQTFAPNMAGTIQSFIG